MCTHSKERSSGEVAKGEAELGELVHERADGRQVPEVEGDDGVAAGLREAKLCGLPAPPPPTPTWKSSSHRAIALRLEV